MRLRPGFIKNQTTPAASPSNQLKFMSDLLKGKPSGQPPQAGKSPLDGAKNLPKMTGPLGVAGTPTMGKPPVGVGLGGANFKPSSTNTTTTDDMMGRRNPTAGLGGVKGLGGIGAALGKKMGMKKIPQKLK